MVIARPAPILLAAALVSACSGARPGERAAAVTVAGPVQLMHHHGETPTTAQAVVSGVLQLDAQGCLRLNNRTLVWPEETSLDLSQPGVVRVFHPDDPQSVRVGQAVAVLAAAPAEAAAERCPGAQLAVTRFAPAT